MKKYLAELVGTFVLTFLGCSAAVSLNCGSDAASVVGGQLLRLVYQLLLWHIPLAVFPVVISIRLSL